MAESMGIEPIGAHVPFTKCWDPTRRPIRKWWT